jgi:hypothetical protein
MDWLDGLDRESVRRICKEIYLNDKRTFNSLLNSLIGSKFDDEDAHLVVDGLCSAGYLDFEGEKMIDVDDAQQKLKDRGYL